jgi:allophanate hydrolase subunit 1
MKAPKPKEYQIMFIYFMHAAYLVQLDAHPNLPKLVQTRQAGEVGSMCMAEMALGVSSLSQHMVYSILHLQGCV